MTNYVTTMTVTREFNFCAGHRLPGHRGKCKHIHGHNYRALLTFEGPLKSDGMVIDFGGIKDLVGRWIDENWDHGFIRAKRDNVMEVVFREFEQSAQIKNEGFMQKVYTVEGNPTAEVMAKTLLDVANALLIEHRGVSCIRVDLHETPNCHATAELFEDQSDG